MNNPVENSFGFAWKLRCMSDDEWLAHYQGKSLEKRHLLRLCDLARNYKSSKEALEKGKYDNGRTWSFQRDYLRLKSYMSSHRWDKEFIKSNFGVSFGAMTQLYFQCVNLEKSAS